MKDAKRGIYANILVKVDDTYPTIFKNRSIINEMNGIIRSSYSILGDARHNYQQLEYRKETPHLVGDLCNKDEEDIRVGNLIYQRAIALVAGSGVSNNGISERFSEVFIPMYDEECQIYANKRELPEIRYTNTTRDYFVFKPVEDVDPKTHTGWMAGGSYIQSPEGKYTESNRRARACFQLLVTNDYYQNGRELVPLHDRKKT